ncbi:bifunctional cobalt-precorrin-7 (C(5))-methyltransferase/cobalt-precorrin-6B (C(15))-methyltransferase [Desulfospira joergensenii]|uniref:bifunctional cobalt-precorrin-7 (C(5))-methyltransferase/cobalt-precorrin-6B (C(15))-methyltransferase n=1 Tax=Desulfospira joergensenii TaxID=53329 RepID=UPI0003B747BB|nr:bifunctional cobalt-precorrin-7 (C(5))-methyltransferase/cobalt-precorrin-6B (C(15))-methyltransferase [Desulfospira joergensenii]
MIQVIGLGMGKQDLTAKQLEIIEGADILVGGKRQLELFPSHGGERLVIRGSMEDLIREIQERMAHKKVVVLASGDPLFYGIGSTLVKRMDKNQLRIQTNISSVSAAFSAIGEPWHDAEIISLHGQAKKNFSFSSLARKNKVAFLTDPENDPAFIADSLIQFRLHGFRVCVLERLGDKDREKITWFDNYAGIKDQTFSHPNLVILLRPGLDTANHYGQNRDNVSHETYLGMDDEQFSHSKGLITKSEIRSIALSKLQLKQKDHVLWDVGSGSGSVGIEASGMIPWGHVYSFEKNPNRIANIVENIKKFNCSNIKVLNQKFPEGTQELAPPDRIFIGGGGRDLESIIQVSCRNLMGNGVIVINTVLIQNMEKSLDVLKKHGFSPQMVQVQVSRSRPMPYGDRMEALNPVWIVWGAKPMDVEKKESANGKE